MNTHRRAIVACGIVDFALTRFAPIFDWYVSDWPSLEMLYASQVFMVPFAALVGWRGAMHAKDLVAGKRGWRKPILEGFLGGLLFVILLNTPFVQIAHAADPPNQPLDLLTVAYLSAALFTFGVVGAVGGACISTVNRLIVRAYAS